MRTVILALLLLAAGALTAQAGQIEGIEPKAGTWRTWVIGSPAQFRIAKPPDRLASESELGELAQLI